MGKKSCEVVRSAWALRLKCPPTPRAVEPGDQGSTQESKSHISSCDLQQCTALEHKIFSLPAAQNTCILCFPNINVYHELHMNEKTKNVVIDNTALRGVGPCSDREHLARSPLCLSLNLSIPEGTASIFG